MMDLMRKTLKTPLRADFSIHRLPSSLPYGILGFRDRSHYRYRNGAINAIDSQAFHKRPEVVIVGVGIGSM
jgi:hypothetical protein